MTLDLKKSASAFIFLAEGKLNIFSNKLLKWTIWRKTKNMNIENERESNLSNLSFAIIIYGHYTKNKTFF